MRMALPGCLCVGACVHPEFWSCVWRCMHKRLARSSWLCVYTVLARGPMVILVCIVKMHTLNLLMPPGYHIEFLCISEYGFSITVGYLASLV